jgi:sugar phosphate isomerase/epimerase
MDPRDLPLHVDLGAVAGADDATAALEALDRLEIRRAQVGPGPRLGEGWAAARRRWEGRLLLHHACLALPEEPRWNLAAGDDDLRGQAVAGATLALEASADLGAAFYAVHAGWMLQLTRGPDDRPVGRTTSPLRARDQLCRSLDRLAAVADRLGIDLLVETAPAIPDERAVLADPEGMVAVLDRLQAPPLGLLADLPALVITARRLAEDPEVVLAYLGDRVRAVELHHGDAVRTRHLPLRETDVELGLAKLAGGLAKPVILGVRGLAPGAIRDQLDLVRDVLGVPPAPKQEEGLSPR